MNTSKASEEAAVRLIVENWASAVRRKDIGAILNNHSRDVLMFDVPPPFYTKGIEDYRKTWDTFYSTATDPVVFDIEELDVTAGAEVAFAVAFMRCRYFDKGTPTDLDFRLTLGMRKLGGQWTITHEHHSIPATS